MYRQNWRADDSGENGEASVLEWEKIQGGIPLHERYIFDTKEKSDPRNTNIFRKFESKLHEVIDAAKLAHRKSRWKLRDIIALLKSTREGTEGNICCWKNRGQPGICRSLHMKVIAGRKLPMVS